MHYRTGWTGGGYTALWDSEWLLQKVRRQIIQDWGYHEGTEYYEGTESTGGWTNYYNGSTAVFTSPSPSNFSGTTVAGTYTDSEGTLVDPAGTYTDSSVTEATANASTEGDPAGTYGDQYGTTVATYSGVTQPSNVTIPVLGTPAPAPSPTPSPAYGEDAVTPSYQPTYYEGTQIGSSAGDTNWVNIYSQENRECIVDYKCKYTIQ